MSANAPVQRMEDIVIRPWAPIIPLKSIPKETIKEKRRALKAKLEKNPPEFYNKPIYKSKKYDLL